MFTGLVQSVGRIVDRETRGGDVRLRVDPHKRGRSDFFSGGDLPASASRAEKNHADSFADIVLGESIAISGVCLTVVATDDDGLAFDVSNETLALTTLGALPIGATVNLERAMLPTDRLGGHLVSGHVDGIGHVFSITADARSQRWRFTAPPALLRYIAVKGSICVDGVSLTVNAVDDESFAVNLIPHTLAHTAFGTMQVGAAVNLEVDLLARYVERLLQAGSGE